MGHPVINTTPTIETECVHVLIRDTVGLHGQTKYTNMNKYKNQSLSLHRFFQASREPIMALTEQYLAIPFPRRIGMPASLKPLTKCEWILPKDPTMKIKSLQSNPVSCIR